MTCAECTAPGAPAHDGPADDGQPDAARAYRATSWRPRFTFVRQATLLTHVSGAICYEVERGQLETATCRGPFEAVCVFRTTSDGRRTPCMWLPLFRPELARSRRRTHRRGGGAMSAAESARDDDAGRAATAERRPVTTLDVADVLAFVDAPGATYEVLAGARIYPPNIPGDVPHCHAVVHLRRTTKRGQYTHGFDIAAHDARALRALGAALLEAADNAPEPPDVRPALSKDGASVWRCRAPR